MIFDLYIDRSRKALVTSRTNKGPFTLPFSFRHDVWQVRISLLDPNPVGGFAAPYTVVDVTTLSCTAAIGKLGEPNFVTQNTWVKDEENDTFSGVLHLGHPAIITEITNTGKDLVTLLAIRITEGGNPDTVLQVPITIAREIVSQGVAPELPSEQQPAADAMEGVLQNSNSIAFNKYTDRIQAEILTPRHAAAVTPVSARVNDLTHLGYRFLPITLDVGAPDADFDLTGLAAGGDGQRILITNATTRKMTLVSQSANSSAANRFKLVADLVMQPSESAEFIYDIEDDRWRFMAPQGLLTAGRIPYADAQGRLTTHANWRFGPGSSGVAAWPGVIGAHSDPGFILADTAAATGSGDTKPTPALRLTGKGWDTFAGASVNSSVEVYFAPGVGTTATMGIDGGNGWAGDVVFRPLSSSPHTNVRINTLGRVGAGWNCPTPAAAFHACVANLSGAADEQGFLAENTSAGSAIVSPPFVWRGQARVTVGPVAKSASMRARMEPEDGSSAVSGAVVWSSSIHDPGTTPSWTNLFWLRTDGRIGVLVNPSARFHLPAGLATAGYAPMKWTTGTFLTATEAGAMEYDGYHLWFTNHDGSSPLERRALGRVHAKVLGDGSANVFTVTHGLNTKRLQRQILEAATGEEIAARCEVIDRDTVKVTAYFVPASNALVLTLTACPNDSSN